MMMAGSTLTSTTPLRFVKIGSDLSCEEKEFLHSKKTDVAVSAHQ